MWIKAIVGNNVRPHVDECNYITFDITQPFPSFTADVVVVSKLFSTLYRNNTAAAEAFLNNLKKAVSNSFQSDTQLIFVDINNIKLGRDLFHQKVKSFLPNFTQYYFDGYSGNNWVQITENGLVFDIPTGLSVNPLLNTIKTVIFEYRK